MGFLNGGVLCFGMLIYGPNLDNDRIYTKHAQPCQSIDFEKIIKKINEIANNNIIYHEIASDDMGDKNALENFMNIVEYIDKLYNDVELSWSMSYYDTPDYCINYYITLKNFPVEMHELKNCENIDLTNYKKVIDFLELEYEDPVMFAIAGSY